MTSGPILESKGMRAIFQKKGKKMLKRAKMYKIWKYFENRTQQTARKGPGLETLQTTFLRLQMTFATQLPKSSKNILFWIFWGLEIDSLLPPNNK